LTDQSYGSSGWQREKTGAFFGLDGWQAMILAAAGFATLSPIYVHQWILVPVVLFFVDLPAVAVVFLRVDGRPLVHFGRDWQAYQRGRAALHHRFVSAPREHTVTADGALIPAGDDPGDLWDMPGVLAPLRHLEVDDGRGGKMAVVNDRNDRSYTTIARVTHNGLALLDSAAQTGRVRGWAGWLAQQCVDDGLVDRIGAYHVAEPGASGDLATWAETHVRADSPPQAVAVLRDKLSAGGDQVASHTSYLSITIKAPSARRQIKAAGGGDVGACAVLAGLCGQVSAAVTAGGVTVERWLAPRELFAVIRGAFVPGDRAELAATALQAGRPGWDGAEPGVGAAFAGPTFCESSLRTYAHDGAWTAVGEIEWPRTRRQYTMLAGVLAAGKGTRHFGLVYHPVGARKAERSLQTDRTKRDGAIRLRHRTGQVAPQREQRELATATAQDAELAVGHGLLRCVGYVAVTVDDPADLEGAWAELCAAASFTGLRLCRVAGWVDAAFACAALPLGMGVPAKGIRL
jgi:hypothetical protein